MKANRSLLDTRRSGAVPVLEGDDTTEVLRRLELRIAHRLDGLLHGDYEGLVPGHGSDLGETRRYVPGDDVRRIDWNISARTNEVHVRETIADRELETWVLVDLTPSLAFGTAGCEKRDLAVAAAAAVGFLTQKTGNRIGGSVLTADGLSRMPPRTGRRHLRSFLHRALSAPSGSGVGPVGLEHAIAAVGQNARRRGLVVVISDFLDPGLWDRALGVVRARHDLLCVEVIDPRELSLPDVGLVELVDVETGRRMEVQTRSKRTRARYQAAAEAQRAEIAAALSRVGADHLQLRTDRDWVEDLVRFVELRHRRIERAGAMR